MRVWWLGVLLCASGCAIAPTADDAAGVEGQEAALSSVPAVAAAAGSVRVMTYNIKHGEESGLDLAKLAAVIVASSPDLLGLQEVDDGTTRSRGSHQVEELAALTGMPYHYFAPSFAFDGGSYGVAILSRVPLTNTSTVRLDDWTTVADGHEPRIAAVADAVVGGKTVTFATLHASLLPGEHAGNAQRLVAGLGARTGRAIVCGDFNETAGEPIGDALVGAGFVDAFHEKHRFFGMTIPSRFPTKRIDFVYRAGALGGDTLHAWVPDSQASDHRPVGVVLPLR